MKPEMTVHAIKLGFICQSTGPRSMRQASSNLSGNDAIEYGGGGYEESR